VEFQRPEIRLVQIDPRIEGGIDGFETHIEVGHEVAARELLRWAGRRCRLSTRTSW
jgi:hypothetical protein